MMRRWTTLLGLTCLLSAATSCDDTRPKGSSEPMGEPFSFAGVCDEPPVSTGLGIGDIAPNLKSTDQYGDAFDLHADLCNKTVLVVRAGFDCGECNDTAPLYGDLYRAHRDDGLVVVTLLHDYVREIDVDALNIWANEYDLQFPVLLDNNMEISSALWEELRRPEVVLLGPGAEILAYSPELEDVPSYL